MQHQNTTAVDAFVASLNGVLLALLGVDYYAMVWAFIGALLAVTQMAKMPRTRAVVYVLLSTLAGALLGSAAFAFLGAGNRVFLAVLSCLGGVGWQTIIALLLKVVESRIKPFLNTGAQNQ